MIHYPGEKPVGPGPRKDFVNHFLPLLRELFEVHYAQSSAHSIIQTSLRLFFLTDKNLLSASIRAAVDKTPAIRVHSLLVDAIRTIRLHSPW
jgi:hypothetical protein